MSVRALTPYPTAKIKAMPRGFQPSYHQGTSLLLGLAEIPHAPPQQLWFPRGTVQTPWQINTCLLKFAHYQEGRDWALQAKEMAMPVQRLKHREAVMGQHPRSAPAAAAPSLLLEPPWHQYSARQQTSQRLCRMEVKM